MERRNAARNCVLFFFVILKLEYDLILFFNLMGCTYRFVWIFVFEMYVQIWSANTTATTVCAQLLPSRGFALTFLKQTSQNYLYASPKNTMLQCYILSDHRKILSHFCVQINFLGSCKGWFLVQLYFYTQYFNVSFLHMTCHLKNNVISFFYNTTKVRNSKVYK